MKTKTKHTLPTTSLVVARLRLSEYMEDRPPDPELQGVYDSIVGAIRSAELLEKGAIAEHEKSERLRSFVRQVRYSLKELGKGDDDA